MSPVWTSIGLAAVLFALFGLVRQRDCGGRCGGCGSGCAHYRKEENDVTR